MKTVISIFIISILCAGTFLSLQSKDKEVCIEDWYAQTSQLFQSASHFFKRSGPSSTEIEEFDAKLQALLPPENLDLSLRAEDQPAITAALNSESALLPNLFNQTNAPGAKIKGQVHTDEKDNIVGAEVNVSIPADIR